MGRRATGWWDERAQRWFVRLGPVSDRNGKHLPVMLRDERGDPIDFDDERGKKRAIERLMRERRDQRPLGGPTAAEICRAYLAWHKEHDSAPRTIDDHYTHLTYFCKFEYGGVPYGERRAVDITPNDLFEIRKSGKGQIRQMYSSILACWNWASLDIEGRRPPKLIESNALKDVKRPEAPAPQDKSIDWQDIRLILRMARGYAKIKAKTRVARTRATRWIKSACLSAMAYCGGRTLEIVTLQWSDIKWNDNVIVIPWQRTKTRKTKKDRVVPMSGRLARLLKFIQKWEHRHDTYVFCCPWHTSIDEREREFWRWIREDFKPYLQAKLGKDRPDLPTTWTAYWMRHSFATDAHEYFGEGSEKALGHGKDVHERRYVHRTTKQAKAVGAAVEKGRKKQASDG